MRKESTESRSESRPEWEQLEDWVRSQVQRLIQELLEEEVTAFLGRAKSALRSDSDNDTGYRNGYGRPRRLTPNPPMDGARTGEGGKGVTGAMIRARIRVDGRLAGGLQALLGAPMSACSGCGERDGRIGHGKRRSRTGMA